MRIHSVRGSDLEADLDRVRRVRARALGDHVGDQHRVVEPVQRQVGARGEHADHPAQHGPDERARV